MGSPLRSRGSFWGADWALGRTSFAPKHIGRPKPGPGRPSAAPASDRAEGSAPAWGAPRVPRGLGAPRGSGAGFWARIGAWGADWALGRTRIAPTRIYRPKPGRRGCVS